MISPSPDSARGDGLRLLLDVATLDLERMNSRALVHDLELVGARSVGFTVEGSNLYSLASMVIVWVGVPPAVSVMLIGSSDPPPGRRNGNGDRTTRVANV